MWRTGIITAQTYIIEDGATEWVFLSTMEHLFDEFPSLSKPPTHRTEISQADIRSSYPLPGSAKVRNGSSGWGPGCLGVITILMMLIFLGQCSSDKHNSSSMPTFHGDISGKATDEDFRKGAEWILDQEKARNERERRNR